MTPAQRDRLRDFAAAHAVAVSDLVWAGIDLAMMKAIQGKKKQPPPRAVGTQATRLGRGGQETV